VSYRLVVRPQVWDDIAAGTEWYEARQPGLGGEFARAVKDRIEEVLKTPLLPRIRDATRSVRWVFPARFPYRIIYRVAGDVILIIAVIHSARHDRHWKRRL
jgi:toxin ParE1/3/4